MDLGSKGFRGIRWAVALALAGHVLSFARTAQRALNAKCNTILPEPPKLGKSLREAEVPRITKEQREQLERDGVIKLEAAVPTPIVESLEPLIWDHAQELNLLPPPWYYNGAVRALIRDGPLAKIAADALSEPKIVSGDMQVWAHRGYSIIKGQTNERISRYHVDERWTINHKNPKMGEKMVTAWLAITDAPASIIFLKGSHRIVRQVYERCIDPGKDGRGIKFGWLDKKCLEGPLVANLTKMLGYNAFYKADAKPGDVFIFHSHLVHAGVEQPDRRTSICIRLRGGPLANQTRGDECLRDRPFNRDNNMVLYPRSPAIDCLPWVMIPELGTSSPIVKTAAQARSSFTYWSKLFLSHLFGQANFIKRMPHLTLPRYTEL